AKVDLESIGRAQFIGVGQTQEKGFGIHRWLPELLAVQDGAEMLLIAAVQEFLPAAQAHSDGPPRVIAFLLVDTPVQGRRDPGRVALDADDFPIQDLLEHLPPGAWALDLVGKS